MFVTSSKQMMHPVGKLCNLTAQTASKFMLILASVDDLSFYQNICSRKEKKNIRLMNFTSTYF